MELVTRNLHGGQFHRICIWTRYLICSHQRRHKLVNLHQSDILAQTHMIPRAKKEHGSLHLARALRICEPALWAVAIAILSKRLLMTLHDPRIRSHDSTARNKLPADSGSRWWHDTFGHQTCRRVQAGRFLDASVEIRQLAGGGIRGLEVC